MQRRVVAGEHAGGHVHAGDQHRLARIHIERTRLALLDHGVDRQVAGADVFGQPQVNQLVGCKLVVHAWLQGSGGPVGWCRGLEVNAKNT